MIHALLGLRNLPWRIAVLVGGGFLLALVAVVGLLRWLGLSWLEILITAILAVALGEARTWMTRRSEHRSDGAPDAD